MLGGTRQLLVSVVIHGSALAEIDELYGLEDRTIRVVALEQFTKPGSSLANLTARQFAVKPENPVEPPVSAVRAQRGNRDN